MSESAGDPGPAQSASATNFEIRVGAKALASLYGIGGLLVLLSVVLPHSSSASEAGMIVVAVMALVIATALYRIAASASLRALSLALAWGTTLVTAVAYFSGESPSPLVFFYLWVFLYSAYFFSRRVAIAETVYVGFSFAVLMSLRSPPSGAVTWWIIGMGILLVAAGLVWVMRVRSEELIARLYAASRTDPLTGLTNRRGFREQLDLELERGRRSQARVSVLAGDLDGFKRINDRLGHHAGDEALRRVAEILEEGKRSIDTVARAGGEEFTLILPDTDGAGAFTAAERLREAIENGLSGAEVPVTISFGVATFPDQGQTAASLLRAADEALYAAKEAGRNKTVRHDDAEGPLPNRRKTGLGVGAERFVTLMLDLAEAVDLRFSGSARHSETVGRYAEMMAQELGFSERRTSRVRLAGMLHDIGKVAIPAAIIDKPGALTDAEFEIAKAHPELGAQIIDHPVLADVRGWVATHHERPDGQGYPYGLAGDAIALEARIVAVADAYEAMTSDRPYRSSIGHAAARTELGRCAGTQFDARVVDAFIAVLDRKFPLAAEDRQPVSSRSRATPVS